MTNNLLNLKKNLKSFAKRCKDFKYTDSALLTFLLSGMLISTGQVFAETVTNSQINNQVSQINTSINQMRTDFKRARAENNKLIKDTNLELTQLMEQGDHVTKSPWSNWQFGINDFYNDWHGTYKGKGDKKASYVFERDKSLVNRSSYPGRIETKYGATILGLVREPNAAMDVSAALTPRNINKFAPKFTLLGAGGGFPDFVARVVKAPDAPNVIPPSFNAPAELDFPASGANPSAGKYSTWGLNNANNDGNISQVSVTGGSVLKKYDTIHSTGVYNARVTSSISIKNLTTSSTSPTVMAAASTTNLGTTVPTGNNTYSNDTQQFFMTLLDSPYTYFDTGTNVAVLSPDNITADSGVAPSHRGTVINMETEGTPGVSFATNTSLTNVLSDLIGYTTETG